MRISPSTILWLAAASSAGKASGEKAESIIFDTTPFQGQYGAVFLITDSSQKPFKWSVNSMVKLDIPITRVDLVVDDGSDDGSVLGTGTNPNAVPLVTTTAVGPSSPTSSSVPLPKMSDDADTGNRGGGGGGALLGDGSGVLLPVGRREEDGEGPGHASGSDAKYQNLLTVIATTSGGTVTILNSSLLATGEHADKKMWFELNWNSGGKTYSRAFTFTTNAERAAILAQQSEYLNSNPVRSQEDPGSSNDDTKTTLPTATTATQAASPTSDPGPTPSGTAAASSSSGLSRGAIAGIAVGAAIVGLALLAVLAFCLIRRRRRERLAQDGPSAFRGNRATPELIAQKEANAGVEVSPHSPYSDDGAGGMLADNSHHVAHQEEMREGRSERAPSYTPYTDRGVVAGGRERDMDGDGGSSLRGSMVTGGRGTPAAPAVRHLVEEGMTEEEIRRLEEEERELDQAIEQAGAARR